MIKFLLMLVWLSLVCSTGAVYAEPEPESGDINATPVIINPALEPATGDDQSEDHGGFEELLAQKDGVSFEYQGRTYIWHDGVPFEQNPDGSLEKIETPAHLFNTDGEGNQWLSLEADGTVYINVAPKVWARINFELNSSVIKVDSEPILDVFGSSLNTPALRRHRLLIAGHTDNTGREEHNLKLSRQRAQSVGRYLTDKHHLEPSRLILHGYGQNKPISDNDTEEGRAQNRRVEFILLNPKEEFDKNNGFDNQ